MPVGQETHGKNRHGTRRAVAATLIRAAAMSTALVFLYYALPLDGKFHGLSLLVLPLSLFLFCLLTWYEIRGVLRSKIPWLRAVEVLATLLPFFLIVFATLYYLMCKHDPTAFSSHFARTDSLYFTITVFSTVGFGDLVPVSESARIAVMVQMMGGVVLIGFGVRALGGAAQRGADRRHDEQSRSSSPPHPIPPDHESD